VKFGLCILQACLITAICFAIPARGATFSFGGNQNGFNGQSSATITSGGISMQLNPGISGSLLSETSSAGMGINSQSVAGVVDSAASLFNNLGGNGPLAGSGESLLFSFDRPGRITRINFDGVKDESLEYFILESSGPMRRNFFDSAGNITVPGAVDAAVMAGAVVGPVTYLLEIGSIDDEAQGLSIPFAAGQQFKLSFASLGPAFNPSEESNGARFQGITVEEVPEPTALLLGLLAAVLGGVWVRLATRRLQVEFN
jgi:hypothetical protein